jgi:hypothetical protein
MQVLRGVVCPRCGNDAYQDYERLMDPLINAEMTGLHECRMFLVTGPAGEQRTVDGEEHMGLMRYDLIGLCRDDQCPICLARGGRFRTGAWHGVTFAGVSWEDVERGLARFARRRQMRDAALADREARREYYGYYSDP